MPDNDHMKTKWPPGLRGRGQVGRVYSALSKIGAENVRGMVLFIRYEGQGGDDVVGMQNAVFTAGEDVEGVFTWAREELTDGQS